MKMADPPAGRLPDTEEEQLELYEKAKGSAQIHGQSFEYKFCALVFLRATNKGYKFKLASNVKGLGAFDDVVVEYLYDNYSKRHIYLQLKSKAKRKITMSQLMSKNGDFSLRKYYDSYIQVEKNFNCGEGGVKMDGSIDESLFIIYSNADVGQDLSSKNVNEGCEEFLMTGGTVLQFNEEKHKAIYEHLQELPKHREFFSRFRIFYNQADEKKMDYYIKRELQQSIKLPESELELAYMCFLDFIKDWWQNCNYFLRENNRIENDPLRNTSEKVRTTLVAKILDQRKSELDDLSIKYKGSAIREMEEMIEPHKAILIFAPGRSTTLTAAKIHQMLSATKHIILNLKQSIHYKTEVMLAWEKSFDVLVLESQKSTENLQEVLNEISKILNEYGGEKTFIFIADTMGNTEQISALRRTFSTKLREEYDSWKFTDIVTESRTFILEKKVIFQGSVIQIKNIVKESDVRMFNALDCDTMSLLLANEEPAIGVPVANTLMYYIDRTLECKTYGKLGSQNESEVLNPIGGGTLKELHCISTYSEKNCNISGDEQDISHLSLAIENEQETTRVCDESHILQNLFKGDEQLPLQQTTDVFGSAHPNFQRNDTTLWRPRTLLDGEDRIILVADEPGMGKSTLLTHLAMVTRQRHPDVWIVRVNINNYTSILHDIKANGFEEESAIKMITEAAQIKETDRVQLEKRMFNYIYKSTGNMAVLIDGVDEVSPHYTEEFIQILKILSKNKLRKIWVTSRNSVKDQLEEEFQCQSYSLLPFSAEDQKSFLVKFWNQKYSNIEKDDIESLANRVVELSFKHLSDKGNHFLGIPLQSLLLAEVFEENLKQCSTSKTIELPENINLFILYNLYVKKKWDIYLTDKKNSDRTNVNVLTDDEALHDIFIENHKTAALIAILSTQQLEKLNEKDALKKVADFLQKIEQGLEKTGIITDIIEGRPVFLHRTFAEYFVARRFCDNIIPSQVFMREHLFKSGFGVIRILMDRLLADKYPLHEAVLNSHMQHVAELLNRKGSITQKDRGGRTPLHIAVSCRSPELIRVLLERGADLSSVDNLLGLSPVEYATRMADWQVLSLLMEKRPDIREQVLHGMNSVCTEHIVSALRAAARYGHTDLLEYLIRKGNYVNMVLPGDSCTLLHEAARSNHIQTVKKLVDLGSSCDIQDANGKTALHVSAETGSLEVAKFIVERQEISYGECIVTLDRAVTKLDRLKVHDKDGNTPLHLAAAAGNTSTVDYLLSAGSDWRSCNTHGEYPLALAARYGRHDTVTLLLNSCSAVKCEEIMTSALTAAIVAGQVEMTALLLRSGAPVNKGENEKSIHIASRLRHKEIVSLLLQNGASLKSRTDSGNTAFHLASEAGQISWVKFLVELDREGLNIPNYKNETPLHLAARNGNVYLVTYLVQNSCNINSASANGATCLHVACENGHYTTVECLLRHGAEINAVNSADQTTIHIAASRGHTKIVKLLLVHNANFTLGDEEGLRALLAATINGHQDTVRLLVQHGGTIEDTDGKGNTIAHIAVTNKNYEILNFLSQENVSFDVQNSDGRTRLWVVAKRGQKSIIRLLLQKGSYANIPVFEGVPPIRTAARECHWDAVDEFLEHDPTIRPNGEEHLKNLLYEASKSGKSEVVRIVLKCGINVDTINGIDATPLHVAAKAGHEEICRMLLQNGASVNVADKAGETPLRLAAANGHEEVFRKLLNHGASVDIANKSGLTPLIAAAIFGNVNVVRELLNHCTSVDIADNDGFTPLNAAAREGHVEVVRELLDHGADVDNSNNNGWTPLSTAGQENQVEVVRELLNRGASVDFVGKEGYTPLHITAFQGHVEIVRELLNRGARMDISNKEGSTPIDVATEFGHVEVVRELLNRGAGMNIVNKDGWTLLHVAASRGHVEIVRELLNRGAGMDIEIKGGWKPIDSAANFGHVKVVRELLNRGARTDVLNTEGFSTLYIAVYQGHVEIIRELLNHGARLDKGNREVFRLTDAVSEYGKVEGCPEMVNHGGRRGDASKPYFKRVYVASKSGHIENVNGLFIKDMYISNALLWTKELQFWKYNAGGRKNKSKSPCNIQ